MSEAFVQSVIRRDAHQHGLKLFRNNVGVLKNEEGRPVRYGLGNDSPALNRALKSGDLIGWRRRLITVADIPDGGLLIAQFASIECKPVGWAYHPNDAHEAAQARWADLVNREGGHAYFSTGGFLP